MLSTLLFLILATLYYELTCANVSKRQVGKVFFDFFLYKNLFCIVINLRTVPKEEKWNRFAENFNRGFF